MCYFIILFIKKCSVAVFSACVSWHFNFLTFAYKNNYKGHGEKQAL